MNLLMSGFGNVYVSIFFSWETGLCCREQWNLEGELGDFMINAMLLIAVLMCTESQNGIFFKFDKSAKQ